MEGSENISEKERELLEELRSSIRNETGSERQSEKSAASVFRKDNIINGIFLTIILALFISEVVIHWPPTYISIEVGILLVSIKIEWMINAQKKYNHFVFWILNSIEFRQNEMARKIRMMEQKLDSQQSS
jgi:hypothetical protein